MMRLDPTPNDYVIANKCVETIRAYWSERGYSRLVIWLERLTIRSNLGPRGYPPGERKATT